MFLGNTGAKDLAEYVAAHKVSAILRRGLHSPATAQLAKQLRVAVCEAWHSVGREATAQIAGWRALTDS